MAKRKFSDITLKEVAERLGFERLTLWELDIPIRQPSDLLTAYLERLRCFDLEGSEAAKLLIVDALCAEVLPEYPSLKAWKSAPLETEEVRGFADYVVAPNRVYLDTPLLCVAEAKKDDFELGQAQCLIEIYACLQKNASSGVAIDLFGIVTNGQAWRFYKRELSGAVYETEYFTTRDLESLLGALDYIFGKCAANWQSVKDARETKT